MMDKTTSMIRSEMAQEIKGIKQMEKLTGIYTISGGKIYEFETCQIIKNGERMIIQSI